MNAIIMANKRQHTRRFGFDVYIFMYTINFDEGLLVEKKTLYLCSCDWMINNNSDEANDTCEVVWYSCTFYQRILSKIMPGISRKKFYPTGKTFVGHFRNVKVGYLQYE